MVNEMKRATRKRIADWIERNRERVILSCALILVLGSLIRETYLGAAIMVMSVVALSLFMTPLEIMIDGIG